MPANSIYYGGPSGLITAATSAQSGYPSANLLSPKVARAWRSVDVTANTVTFTWANAVNVSALWLNDVNFSGNVDVSTNGGSTWVALGAFVSLADKWFGRYRAYIDVNQTINGIRFTPTGSALDALTYWRCGAVFIFTGVTALPRMPEMGMQIIPVFPYSRNDLPNKQTALASSGVDYLTYQFQYLRRWDQDVLEIVRRARAGVIGFSLQPNNFTEVFSPVRYFEDTLTDTFNQLNFTQPQIVLREVA